MVAKLKRNRNTAKYVRNEKQISVRYVKKVTGELENVNDILVKIEYK